MFVHPLPTGKSNQYLKHITIQVCPPLVIAERGAGVWGVCGGRALSGYIN